MRKQELTYNQMDYLFWHPDHLEEGKKYPTVIYCHGAGSRGPNPTALRNNLFFTETERFLSEALTFLPRCDKNCWFDVYEQLNCFIDEVLCHPNVDQSRVYLMGVSMGGYAVWQLAMSRPELYAAVVPICGGGMYWNAPRLKDVPIWAFHGDRDDVVFPEESRKMVDAVNRAGGNAKLTLCQNVCHDSWLNAYRSKELFDWLFTQKNTRMEVLK